MEIQNFKFVNKSPVICSFDVFFPTLGLGIREFRLMESNGKKWVAAPARQYQDETGKKKYFTFAYFQAPERKSSFEKKITDLLTPMLNAFPASQPSFLKTSEESPF